MPRRRAISHVVAALLVALMVVGIALGLYAYFNGWFASKTGNLQTSENLLVIQSAYYNETNTGAGFVYEIDLYVANLGESDATIAFVTIADAATGKIVADHAANALIPANSVSKIVVPLNGPLSGVFEVKIIADDGSTAAYTLWAS